MKFLDIVLTSVLHRNIWKGTLTRPDELVSSSSLSRPIFRSHTNCPFGVKATFARIPRPLFVRCFSPRSWCAPPGGVIHNWVSARGKLFVLYKDEAGERRRGNKLVRPSKCPLPYIGIQHGNENNAQKLHDTNGFVFHCVCSFLCMQEKGNAACGVCMKWKYIFQK